MWKAIWQVLADHRNDPFVARPIGMWQCLVGSMDLYFWVGILVIFAGGVWAASENKDGTVNREMIVYELNRSVRVIRQFFAVYSAIVYMDLFVEFLTWQDDFSWRVRFFSLVIIFNGFVVLGYLLGQTACYGRRYLIDKANKEEPADAVLSIAHEPRG